jgi:hypothetical protein
VRLRREIGILVLLLLAAASLTYMGSSEGTEGSARERIEISSDWGGPPPIHDRDEEVEFNLTGPGGMFDGSIGEVSSIMIFNEYDNKYQSFIEMDFFNMYILRIEDRWIASVEVWKYVGGSCNLTFRVENSTRIDEVLLEINITIVNNPPVIPEEYVFYPDWNEKLYVGEKIWFSAREVMDPEKDELTYFWDFGDGSTATGMNASHTYGRKGFKTVSLWISDGYLETERIYQRIEILEESHSYIDDRDYDGVKDSLDAFPDDWSASIDTDEDGYPDSWNKGRDMADSRTGLKLDNYPEDPDRNGYEIEDNNGVVLLLALILVSLIIIAFLVVAMIVVFLKEKRKEKSLDHNRISN